VNNPGAGDGFTVIFDKARDEKKTGGAVRVQDSPFRAEAVEIQKSQPTHESSVSNVEMYLYDILNCTLSSHIRRCLMGANLDVYTYESQWQIEAI
jgi:hypothetical protein